MDPFVAQLVHLFTVHRTRVKCVFIDHVASYQFGLSLWCQSHNGIVSPLLGEGRSRIVSLHHHAV